MRCFHTPNVWELSIQGLHLARIWPQFIIGSYPACSQVQALVYVVQLVPAELLLSPMTHRNGGIEPIADSTPTPTKSPEEFSQQLLYMLKGTVGKRD